MHSGQGAEPIFDQTRVLSKKDQQDIDIAPSAYSGDDEVEPILCRLLEASCDSDVRREMDVEAEELWAQAEERAERMIRCTVIALLKKMMTADDIAGILGIDIQVVKQIASKEHLVYGRTENAIRILRIYSVSGHGSNSSSSSVHC